MRWKWFWSRRKEKTLTKVFYPCIDAKQCFCGKVLYKNRQTDFGLWPFYGMHRVNQRWFNYVNAKIIDFEQNSRSIRYVNGSSLREDRALQIPDFFVYHLKISLAFNSCVSTNIFLIFPFWFLKIRAFQRFFFSHFRTQQSRIQMFSILKWSLMFL